MDTGVKQERQKNFCASILSQCKIEKKKLEEPKDAFYLHV